MAINVLITSASRKVGLINSFRQAIDSETGGQVIAVDIDPKSAALYHADQSYLVPRSDDSKFIPNIKRLCKKHSIDLIVPTRDEELGIFARSKDDFSEFGTRIMVSSPETVDVCNDKSRFLDWCNQNGYATPKTYSRSEIKSNQSTLFPLFLKDRYGKSSKKTFIVTTNDELNAILAYLDDPIIQEFVDEKEFTIDYFADFTGRTISVVPRERVDTFGGESFVGKTRKEERLINKSIKLAQDLKLIGHNTIQCFYDGGEVKFIEVNPRYGGGANLGFAAGHNTPHYTVKLLLGKEVSSKVGDFTDGLFMLRYTQDTFVTTNDTEQITRVD